MGCHLGGSAVFLDFQCVVWSMVGACPPLTGKIPMYMRESQSTVCKTQPQKTVCVLGPMSKQTKEMSVEREPDSGLYVGVSGRRDSGFSLVKTDYIRSNKTKMRLPISFSRVIQFPWTRNPWAPLHSVLNNFLRVKVKAGLSTQLIASEIIVIWNSEK